MHACTCVVDIAGFGEYVYVCMRVHVLLISLGLVSALLYALLYVCMHVCDLKYTLHLQTTSYCILVVSCVLCVPFQPSRVLVVSCVLCVPFQPSRVLVVSCVLCVPFQPSRVLVVSCVLSVPFQNTFR